MKSAAAILVALAAAASAWSQASGTTSVTFTTRDDRKVAVYELQVVVGGPGAAYLQVADLVPPTFVAPVVLDLPDGVHAYQVGTGQLFPRRFEVKADGTPQVWRLDPGSPALQTAGWIVLGVGLAVAALGVYDWRSAPWAPTISSAPSEEIAGVLIGSAGLVLLLSSQPSVSRVR